MKSTMITCSILPAILIAGFVQACTAASPGERGEETNDLASAQEGDLVGSYEVKAGTSPYGFVDDLVGISFAPNGQFFARIAMSCDAIEGRVWGRISGSYASLPNGQVALTTDLGALGPLPAVCKAQVANRFGGTFALTVGSAEIRLEKQIDAWNSVRYLVHRVDSYCTQATDCAALGLPHDACEGGYSCGAGSSRCSYACTPIVAPGSLQIRVPSPLPADGSTEIPIFVDTTDPALAKAAFVLSLSRPSAGKLSTTSVKIGPVGFRQGLWAGTAATSYFAPCDGAVDASCLGPVTISIALEGQSTPLAEATVELVPATEDLPGTACLGGGNVIEADFITAIGLSTIGAAHSTEVVGRFAGHAYLNASVGGGVSYLDISLDGKNTSADVELSGPTLDVGTFPVTSSGGTSTTYGLSVGVQGDGLPAGSSGRARIIELAYVDPTAPLKDGVEIARATVAWEVKTLLGAKVTTLRGCAHYDRLAPPYGCGDGVVDPGEQCDDGNTDSTDGCLSNCKLARCGDGIVQPGVEQCDDGNTRGQDGCSATCTVEAKAAVWSCDASYYDEGNKADAYCDCNCGVPDPDCALSLPVYGCGVGQTCSASGQCQG